MSEATARAELKYYKLTEAEKTEIINALRTGLLREEDIIFAYLHGSFLEQDRFKDVDVAVWAKGEADPLHYAVDISVEVGARLGFSLDIHALNDVPLPIRYRVLAKGKPIFCRDENLRWRLVDETIRQYLDLKLLHSDKQR